MMAAAALAGGGISLLLLARWILQDATNAAIGACGALVGFAGAVCVIAAPLALF